MATEQPVETNYDANRVRPFPKDAPLNIGETGSAPTDRAGGPDHNGTSKVYPLTADQTGTGLEEVVTEA